MTEFILTIRHAPGEKAVTFKGTIENLMDKYKLSSVLEGKTCLKDKVHQMREILSSLGVFPNPQIDCHVEEIV